MRKYTRRILAALLCMLLAGALLPGRMTYAANNDAQLPEPEVIVTPVEYDAAEDSMTFEISTNREDIGIAYIDDHALNEEYRLYLFNEAKVTYGVATVKCRSWGYLSVWLLDKDGNRLHDYDDYEPDYEDWFGGGYGRYRDYLLEDRENKIKIVNSNDSYNPNMYIENGILYYDSSREDSKFDWRIFDITYTTSDGNISPWWVIGDGWYEPYGITDSGKNYVDLSSWFYHTGTYEIAAREGQVYRVYCDYVRPVISVGEVSGITWSPEQPGIFTFKPCENAGYYEWDVYYKSGEDDFWRLFVVNYDDFGFYDYYDNYSGLWQTLQDYYITISDGVGTLDLSNEDFVKDATSFQVKMRAMSNDIEKMAHGEWVYSEFTTNPSQNPSESNPEPKPSTEPTTPAEPKPSTEPTTPTNPAEPDAKPENPTVSPDDEEDDDDGSITVAVTGGSADSTTVGKDSTIINKDNPPVRADNIVEVTKVEASPTADGSHIYLYIVLAGLSLGIFAVYMSKEKKMN